MIGKLVGSAGFLSSGGTIGGDLTISGDLTVSGGGGFSYSEVLTGDMTISSADGVNSTAFLLSVTNLDATDGQSQGIFIRAGNGTSDYPLKINNRAQDLAILHVRGDGNVGIGVTDPATLLHLESADDNEPILQIKTTHADNHGGMLKFSKISASEADDDELGDIGWYGYDAGNNETRYGLIRASSTDITDGDEGGKIQFYVHAGGTAGTAADKELFSIGGEDVANATACAVVINEAGIDSDFRVEASGEANALFVQGSDGAVGIGTDDPGYLMHLNTSSRPTMGLTSTDAGADPGPIIYLERHSGSPTDGDNIGSIYFQSYNDASESTTFARMRGVMVDASNGDEEGGIRFDTTLGGDTSVEAMRIVGGNVGIGTTEPSQELEIKFDTDKHMLFSDSQGETGNCPTIHTVNTAGSALVEFGVRASEIRLATGSAKRMVLDDNSRISLSNNDGNTGNTVFGYHTLSNAGTVLGNVGADYNVAVGHLAMGTGTTTDATYNTGIGTYSLQDITDGDHNSSLGASALGNLTEGSENVGIGSGAGELLTTANKCVFIGRQAGDAVTVTNGANSDGTVAVGYQALTALTSGEGNTAVGYKAGIGIDAGAGNVVMGYSAMGNMYESGGNALNYNVAIGYQAMYGEGSAVCDETVAVGAYALKEITSGVGNLAIGYQASAGLTTSTNNISLGYNALYRATTAADNNIAIGSSSMSGNWTTANVNDCVAIGHETLTEVLTTDASGSVAVGKWALSALTSGAGNTAVGYTAGDEISTGAQNTLIGYGAMHNADAGESNNTCVGYLAGDDIDGGGTCTIIGSTADAAGATAANQTILGYNTQGVADNSVVLGNASVTDVYMSQDSQAYVHSQNVPNHVANTMSSPYYRFDGADDYITPSSAFGLINGAFSISTWVNKQTNTTDWEVFYSQDVTEIWFGMGGTSQNGRVRCHLGGGDYVDTADGVVTNGTWAHVVVAWDGSTAQIYVNGVSQTLTTSGTPHNPASQSAFTIGKGSGGGNFLEAQMSSISFWNKALTATEVKELYSGASVPFKYKGANQTEVLTSTVTNNGGSYGYDTFSSADATGFTGVVTGNAYYRAVDIESMNTITKGRAYRFKYDLTLNSGSGPRIGHSGNTDYNSGALSAGTNNTLEFVMATNELYIFNPAGESSNFVIDNMSLVPIGAVAEYDGSGIGASRWDDKSGNELHGTVSGATVENAPADADSGLTYEEGTFTPTILLGGTEISTNSGTYNSAQTQGSYTKIGNRVLFNMRVGITNKGGETGDMRVAGLPFTVAADPQSVAALSLTMWVVSYADTPFAQADESSSTVGLFEVTNSGTYSTLTDGNLAAGATNAFIQVAGNYHI